jgi:hypothetical protein
MKRNRVPMLIVLIACLMSASCKRQSEVREAAPFRIIATDAGFEAPDRIASGLRHIVFENHGSEIHESMLVKLPPGMSAEDYVAAVKKGSDFPEGALDYSGPGLTSPGESAEMWLRVDPGQYILICWNRDHETTKPVHKFLAEEIGASDDQTPKEDLVLKLFDYRFELSPDLHKGVQVIRIETPGPSMHEVDIFRLHEGKTVADLKSWQKQQEDHGTPADALGGALDSHDINRVVWLRKNFTPGRYVLHCAMSVKNSKLTHADVGMVREFEIKE